METEKCLAEFNGYFSPSRKCIFIDGEGEAEIKLTADATQLAGVISALAACRSEQMVIKFYKTPRRPHNGKVKGEFKG